MNDNKFPIFFVRDEVGLEGWRMGLRSEVKYIRNHYFKVSENLPFEGESVYARGIDPADPFHEYDCSAEYSSSYGFFDRRRPGLPFNGVFEWWSAGHYVTHDLVDLYFNALVNALKDVENSEHDWTVEIIYPDGNGPWHISKLNEFSLRASWGVPFFLIACDPRGVGTVYEAFKRGYKDLKELHERLSDVKASNHL